MATFTQQPGSLQAPNLAGIKEGDTVVLGTGTYQYGPGGSYKLVSPPPTPAQTPASPVSVQQPNVSQSTQAAPVAQKTAQASLPTYAPTPIVPSADAEIVRKRIEERTGRMFDEGSAELQAARQFAIDAARIQAQAQRQRQEDVNRRALQSVQTAAIRSGRDRYTPEISAGIVRAEEEAGLQRIADIDAREQALIAQANAAFSDKQFALLSERIQSLNTLDKERIDEFVKLQQLSQEEERKATTEARARAEDQAVISIFQNGITDPAAIYGELKGSVDPERIGEIVGALKMTDAEQDTLKGTSAEYQTFRQLYNAGELPKDLQSLDAGTAFLEWQRQQKVATTAPARPDVVTARELSKDQASLRKEFNQLPIVKDFNDVSRSYNQIQSAYGEAVQKEKDKKSRAAADQVLITAFNKMIDPGSVVKEGEFARSTNGQSIINRLSGLANKALEGGAGLADEDRRAIVDVTETLYQDYLKLYNREAQFYKEIATESGLDPNRVIRPATTEEQPKGEVSDVDDLKSAAQEKGFDPSEVDELLKQNYTPEQIRLIIES